MLPLQNPSLDPGPQVREDKELIRKGKRRRKNMPKELLRRRKKGCILKRKES